MDPIDMKVVEYNAEYLGISRLILMENAGAALAKYIDSIHEPTKVFIFTGNGGNAGDGFVAARHLLNRGFKVELVLLRDPSEIHSEEARTNWDIIKNIDRNIESLSIKICPSIEELHSDILIGYGNIIIDAILGTGVQSKIKEPLKSYIKFINQSQAIKISVDVPTGLDPLTGDLADVYIAPDYTLTFHKSKSGLLKSQNNIGKLIICNIGIPKSAEMIVGEGDLLRIPSRKNNAHKGDNGHLLIVGGSKEYSGAPALSGLSALAAGVDSVIIACPDIVSTPIRSYSPDLIVRPIPGVYINQSSSETIVDLSLKSDAILIGPGLGEERETKIALNTIIKNLNENKPLILDADALKLVKKGYINNNQNLIITPHFKEFKTFFNEPSITPYDNKEKLKIMSSITQKIEGTVLLKGETDIIFNGDTYKLNKTGTSGMTVGGTGDSLAGLVASFCAQGISPWDSACISAFINGKAGEYTEKIWGKGFTTSKMIESIHDVLNTKII